MRTDKKECYKSPTGKHKWLKTMDLSSFKDVTKMVKFEVPVCEYCDTLKVSKKHKVQVPPRYRVV